MLNKYLSSVKSSPSYTERITERSGIRVPCEQAVSLYFCMDIFSVITLLGGLAFFLYGMHVMSTGLEKMAGGKLERILKRMTSSPLKSLLLGAGITIAIQSSSAMTVMLVGLVNSGIMQLEQTVGVNMGSNIGTTLTAWILSLAGIESENVWLKLLKPENFAPIIALVGIILLMAAKEKRKKDIGVICIGFSILMYGMELMSGAVSPIAEIPEFQHLLTAFKNPLLGVLVGAVFTGVIQSSAASVGILQALSMTGSITCSMAFPVIMGQNIGTCVTALLSSFGVNKNAKRVAAIHMSFNLLGTILCLAVFYGLNAIFHFPFMEMAINPLGIAAAHSIFNIVTTAVLLPFSRLLVKLANIVIRDNAEKESYTFLDERLLNTPSFAISECNNMTVKMAEISRNTILQAIRLTGNYQEKDAQKVLENEDRLGLFEDKLGTYLVKLSSKALSDSDSKQISKMLHTIGDFERLGDHAVNILNVAQEIHEKRLSFSDEAKKDLHQLMPALQEILELTMTAFESNDIPLATHVEPLEQVIDCLIAEIKRNHIERLQSGKCTIEMGFVLSDLLTNFERVSDHCSNIAVAMIEVDRNSFGTHEYLSSVKSMNNELFNARFSDYCEKYGVER